VTYGKANLDSPEIALPALHRGADLFSLHPQFLDAPAYYAIFAHSRGILSSDVALTEVENALRYHPNSEYLRQHYSLLHGERP
jgi:hypothetical protein